MLTICLPKKDVARDEYVECVGFERTSNSHPGRVLFRTFVITVVASKLETPIYVIRYVCVCF